MKDTPPLRVPPSPLWSAAVLLLAACSAGPRAVIPPSPAQVSGDFQVEITVTTETWIILSEPAYVAVFRVQSGRGALLHWPYSAQRDFYFQAGRTPLPEWEEWERDARDDWGYVAMPETHGSRRSFLLVVASPEPLRVRPFLRDPTYLMEALGDDYFEETSLVEGIFDEVVPFRDTQTWGWACVGVSMQMIATDAQRLGRGRNLRVQRQCPRRESVDGS